MTTSFGAAAFGFATGRTGVMAGAALPPPPR